MLDARALDELAEEARDDEARAEAAAHADEVGRQVERLEFRRMLSGAHDAANAIVEVKSGAGGVEAMDWAAMLYRMYVRYCERKGWEVEPADLVAGEEAGISSASFIARGEYAYGFLKAERGVHRLVRISPFDSAARRQTSFAAVDVTPEIDDDIVIDIKEADVRVDTYRSSGAGGQKVNKTDSAVRLTHIPTGIVVAVQNERSQQKNRGVAWKILRSRLYDHEERKRQAARDAGGGEEEGHRLRIADPQLRAAALPAGEGPPHRDRDRQGGRPPRRGSGRVHPALPAGRAAHRPGDRRLARRFVKVATTARRRWAGAPGRTARWRPPPIRGLRGA